MQDQQILVRKARAELVRDQQILTREEEEAAAEAGREGEARSVWGESCQRLSS